MKYFAAILLIALVAGVHSLTDDQKKHIKEVLHEHSNACKTELGISDELIEQAKKHENVSDPKLKDLLVCVNKKSGVMDASGQLQIAALKTKLTGVIGEDKATKVVDACAVNKATPQETAVELIKCLHGLKVQASN